MMDDKNTKDAPECKPIIEVRDPRVEYAEEQDRKRREFEQEQERLRREFEAAMEKKKAKRDWLTVLFAGVAAACAIWAAYEAHVLGSISRNSLAVQVQAMRRAEQPFVYPKPGEWQVVKFDDVVKVQASVTPIITGNTPAMNVKVQFSCKVGPVNTRVALSVTKPDIEIASFSFQEPSQRELTRICVNENGESVVKSDSIAIFMFGQFQYEDLLGVIHHTPFCFSSVAHLWDNKGKLETCSSDYPVNRVD
jgi:hypothetical protein